MDIIQMLIDEMNQEGKITRRMLERVPADKFSWKPHEKSMTMKQLSVHIAELPAWVSMAINTDELDFENTPYVPSEVHTTQELVDLHEKSLKEGIDSLKTTSVEVLQRPWVLRSGTHIISTSPKMGIIRMAFNQITHHRAQLGVYLRLLNIPIPGTYGPSADEPAF